MEAHPKVRPMDFADDGLYLAGMAHYPKFIEESIAHALACAGRALTVLSRPSLQVGGVVAVVDPERCTGCLACARTCPFGIPAMRSDLSGVGGLGGSAWIDPARCRFVTEVAFKPNRLLLFLNSVGAHGAHIPDDAQPEALERYIYQFRVGPSVESMTMLKATLAEDRRSYWAGKAGEY